MHLHLYFDNKLFLSRLYFVFSTNYPNGLIKPFTPFISIPNNKGPAATSSNPSYSHLRPPPTGGTEPLGHRDVHGANSPMGRPLGPWTLRNDGMPNRTAGRATTRWEGLWDLRPLRENVS
jgi:hypothetical protein